MVHPPSRRGAAAALAASVFVVAALASSPATASGERRPPARFDDEVRLRAGGVIATAPIELDRMQAADPLRAKWESFRTREGGRWEVYLDGRTARPTLVAGSGIELFAPGAADGATLDDVDRHVRDHLERSGIVTRGEVAQLVLDPHASGRVGKDRWQVVYRQSVDGVLVENSRFDLHVVGGKLTMFGWTNWGSVTVGGAPSLDASVARAALDAYLGVRTADFEAVGALELSLVAVDADAAAARPRTWKGARGAGLAHVLIWRIQFREAASPAVWTAEIDAHSGAVRAFYDGADYASVRGGVFPISPNVGCTSGSCEMAAFPMPFADWSEAGQPALVADAHGNLTCSDPTATLTTHLSGPYATVDDTCGPVSETATCGGGLDLGVKAGENCAVAAGASPGNTAAARSAFYHVNRVNQVARSYLPTLSWLNQPVTLATNWDSVCNASYGNNSIYVYRSGTSTATCANSGEIEGIVVHEWGHGLDFNDGGGADNTSEAYGDLVAMLASRQSCFGPGLFTDGRTCSGYGDTCLTCTGFRDWDWDKRIEHTPATPRTYVATHCSPGSGPCGYGVHCEAYPIDEAMYDLATRDLPASGMDLDTAWQLVERLWYLTRPGSGGDIYTCALPDSDSCSATSWYQRMRVADDDDANLANGTPHAAALYAAFARHAIACGGAGDPENQSTSSCPTLSRPDLAIDGSGAAPQLDWTPVPGAVSYVVFRDDLGCSHQQVAVATVPVGTTTYVDALPDPGLPRYYRIQAVGSNPVCVSPVSNCEVTGTGPRLQLGSHGMIEDGAYDNGDGFPDPGETWTIPVTLFNGGTEDATGVDARLRTVDPSQGRVIQPTVDFPNVAKQTEVASTAPHYRLTLFQPGASCGDVVPMELEMHAANAPTRTDRFNIALGDRRRDFINANAVMIPRLTTVPVTSTVTVDQDQTVAEVDATVVINHPNAAELAVDLVSPAGTTVRLHDHTSTGGGIATTYDDLTAPSGPGTMNDFVGEDARGTWTLKVYDTIFGGPAGTLNRFELHLRVVGGFDCSVVSCPEPTPSTSPSGLVVGKQVNGVDGTTDLTFSWNAVGGVAGYHLLQSTKPQFDAQVDLAGRTSGATSLTLANGAATTPDLTYFLVRAANECDQESP